MSEENEKHKSLRWYDRDEIVSKGMDTLKNIPDKKKRQIATYLGEEIISKKPYCDMYPLDTHYLILSETRRNRWYDYDETVHIFMELLRHCSDQQKIDISQKLLCFVEELT